MEILGSRRRSSSRLACKLICSQMGQGGKVEQWTLTRDRSTTIRRHIYPDHGPHETALYRNEKARRGRRSSRRRLLHCICFHKETEGEALSGVLIDQRIYTSSPYLPSTARFGRLLPEINRVWNRKMTRGSKKKGNMEEHGYGWAT